MSYILILAPQAEEEIREQALYYQDQFSSGINDFIDAIHDTYDRILPFPLGNPMVQELADKTIRGIHVQANKKRLNYAKDFPFKLIYKVYSEKEEVVVYHLWPEKSDRRVEGEK